MLCLGSHFRACNPIRPTHVPSTDNIRPGEILVLGIETSCDETAAAVVARDAVTAAAEFCRTSCARSGRAIAPFGGVVPEIAARAHVECLDDIVREALRDRRRHASRPRRHRRDRRSRPRSAALIVGLVTAKALALASDLPLVAVNHLEAHALTVGLTEGLRHPTCCCSSPAGTRQLLAVEDVGRYRRLGTTIDDALGEAFDKTAKLLGLGFPGGPAVERAARGGNPTRFALPRPMMGREVPHFSFAGLKTAVRQTAAIA